MKKDRLDILENIDEKYIIEAADAKKSHRNRVFAAYGSIAACAALALAIGVFVYHSPSPDIIPLSAYSTNVKVQYYDGEIAKVSSYSDTMNFSPKEIFSMTETAFKGTVTDIQNIQIDCNGIKEYRSIATITVEKTYRGSCAENDVVTIMLPCPITKDSFWVEDTDVVAQMKVGTSGIFLLKEYGSDDYYRANNCELLLSDIANYGFYDGHRFAFIETENGLVFDKSVHEKIANATTLDEAEEYVLKMIK